MNSRENFQQISEVYKKFTETFAVTDNAREIVRYGKKQFNFTLKYADVQLFIKERKLWDEDTIFFFSSDLGQMFYNDTIQHSSLLQNYLIDCFNLLLSPKPSIKTSGANTPTASSSNNSNSSNSPDSSNSSKSTKPGHKPNVIISILCTLLNARLISNYFIKINNGDSDSDKEYFTDYGGSAGNNANNANNANKTDPDNQDALPDNAASNETNNNNNNSYLPAAEQKNGLPNVLSPRFSNKSSGGSSHVNASVSTATAGFNTNYDSSEESGNNGDGNSGSNSSSIGEALRIKLKLLEPVKVRQVFELYCNNWRVLSAISAINGMHATQSVLSLYHFSWMLFDFNFKKCDIVDCFNANEVEAESRLLDQFRSKIKHVIARYNIDVKCVILCKYDFNYLTVAANARSAANPTNSGNNANNANGAQRGGNGRNYGIYGRNLNRRDYDSSDSESSDDEESSDQAEVESVIHYACIAAFHEASDRVLLLDHTMRAAYWVKIESLFRAMTSVSTAMSPTSPTSQNNISNLPELTDVGKIGINDGKDGKDGNEVKNGKMRDYRDDRSISSALLQTAQITRARVHARGKIGNGRKSLQNKLFDETKEKHNGYIIIKGIPLWHSKENKTLKQRLRELERRERAKLKSNEYRAKKSKISVEMEPNEREPDQTSNASNATNSYKKDLNESKEASKIMTAPKEPLVTGTVVPMEDLHSMAQALKPDEVDDDNDDEQQQASSNPTSGASDANQVKSNSDAKSGRNSKISNNFQDFKIPFNLMPITRSRSTLTNEEILDEMNSSHEKLNQIDSKTAALVGDIANVNDISQNSHKRSRSRSRTSRVALSNNPSNTGSSSNKPSLINKISAKMDKNEHKIENTSKTSNTSKILTMTPNRHAMQQTQQVSAFSIDPKSGSSAGSGSSGFSGSSGSTGSSPSATKQMEQFRNVRLISSDQYRSHSNNIKHDESSYIRLFGPTGFKSNQNSVNTQNQVMPHDGDDMNLSSSDDDDENANANGNDSKQSRSRSRGRSSKSSKKSKNSQKNEPGRSVSLGPVRNERNGGMQLKNRAVMFNTPNKMSSKKSDAKRNEASSNPFSSKNSSSLKKASLTRKTREKERNVMPVAPTAGSYNVGKRKSKSRSARHGTNSSHGAHHSRRSSRGHGYNNSLVNGGIAEFDANFYDRDDAGPVGSIKGHHRRKSSGRQRYASVSHVRNNSLKSTDLGTHANSLNKFAKFDSEEGQILWNETIETNETNKTNELKDEENVENDENVKNSNKKNKNVEVVDGMIDNYFESNHSNADGLVCVAICLNSSENKKDVVVDGKDGKLSENKMIEMYPNVCSQERFEKLRDERQSEREQMGGADLGVDDVENDSDNNVPNIDYILKYGMSLLQMKNVLMCFGLKQVEIVYSYDFSDLSEFRLFIMKSLNLDDNSNLYDDDDDDENDKKNKQVLINYDLFELGTGISCGHFSGVAGYNKQNDLILLFDTFWMVGKRWIPLSIIYNAINTIDSNVGKYRGVVVIDDV